MLPIRMRHTATAVCVGIACLLAVAHTILADEPGQPTTAPADIELNFPENVDLKVLIDYVARRQGVTFLYTEEIANKKITLKTQQRVSADQLTPLLESALAMKGLALAPADMPNVFRVVNLTDRPRKTQTRFIPVAHCEPAQLATKVTQLLAARGKGRPDAAGATITPDERTSQLIVMGSAEEVADALSLIGTLDAPLGMETKTYSLQYVAPDRVDRLARELLGESLAKRSYKSAVDRGSSLLIVTATPAVHARLANLRDTLDKPIPDMQTPIRFYKLENARAADVIETLQGIEGEGGGTGGATSGAAGNGSGGVDSAVAALGKADDRMLKGPTQNDVNQPPLIADSAGVGGRNYLANSTGPTQRKGASARLKNAHVTADEPSNTLIVVASAADQVAYEKLIKQLDIRQPQVLVEATVVQFDTTDNFSLGVEIGSPKNAFKGDNKVLTFSSFGLSTVNPSTGEVTLKPGTGFNGAVLSADVANVIVRALETDKRVKVVSRPSVLINDNAVGVLSSESEEPFASINSNTSIATQSFGGYATAGTLIAVKPQISQGEHLKLEYQITLSSFGDARTDSLPPARQKNELKSLVTIPNGHTIVVGGLTRESLSHTVDRVPGLGRIPVLEYLFSSRTRDARKTTLFVFLRAVVLRDDKFEDIKALSGGAAGRAGLPPDFPRSEPVEIR